MSVQKKYLEELTGGFALALSFLLLVFILGIALLLGLSYAMAPIREELPGLSHYFFVMVGNFCGSIWVLLSLLPISLLNLILGWRLKGSLSRGWKAAAWVSLITGSLGLLVSLGLIVLSRLD